MQKPLFEHYEVDEAMFWKEVNALEKFYAEYGLKVADDTAYLEHTLNYVRNGKFSGLTNGILRELGSKVELAPGMPDFMEQTRKLVQDDDRYAKNLISVEHYVVSTGLRQMIEGNAIYEHIDGVWACEFLPAAPASQDGALSPDTFDPDGILTQIGYTIDNTTKTRALFEINKGINKLSGVNVNARMSHDERRVPFGNMIYIADGPSDIPVFSVVSERGGKTLAVYSEKNYEGVQQLNDEGRVNQTAMADYRESTDAYRWLMRSLRMIADKICEASDSEIGKIMNPARHAT
ncbi:haloacid dehalogenase-like hydrolase [Mycobacteroides chelonae]|uniref:haloacid dehalogenase-like hydrolase n=1 Tax=Mycobacteroides chelonae TaxID=1774 RepID=UPI001F0A7469|nr:haloacid dehalogenase-like hydrolase [Mycobacteroides chelonae]